MHKRHISILLLQALALSLAALFLSHASPPSSSSFPSPLQAAQIEYDHFLYLPHLSRNFASGTTIGFARQP